MRYEREEPKRVVSIRLSESELKALDQLREAIHDRARAGREVGHPGSDGIYGYRHSWKAPSRGEVVVVACRIAAEKVAADEAAGPEPPAEPLPGQTRIS